jgi:hypothetical protein
MEAAMEAAMEASQFVRIYCIVSLFFVGSFAITKH